MTRHVYIISSIRNGLHAAPVKIGVARNPNSRLQCLQTGSAIHLALTFSFPLPKSIPADEIERQAHTYFSSKRIRGEWFDVTPNEAAFWVADLIYNYLRKVRLTPDEDKVVFRSIGDGMNLPQDIFPPADQWAPEYRP